MKQPSRLSTVRKIILGTAVLLILLSWLMVWRARSGLEILTFTVGGIPMRYIGPEGGTAVPGVVIAHGFSGSQQLMQAFAYTLAHAGYGTLSFDFDGHAANPAPLDVNGGTLQANMAAATTALQAQPAVDGARLALLGHSMGSGAVMTAGIEQVDQYRATIAVSPTGAEVTETAPRNLLLQAGALEPQFAANAEELLARAGGADADMANGRGRSFQRVPGVEHISILFSPTAHQGALGWLEQTFGPQRASGYVDLRMGWYLLHLAGWLLLATAVAPLIRRPAMPAAGVRRAPWHMAGLLVAPLVAAGGLALVNGLLPVGGLGGVLIAGALGLWFLIFGLVWLLVGIRPWSPSARSLVCGLGIFAFLWLAFGLMAQVVWLPWLLIPARLLRWPLLALAFFPWLLAAGWVQQGATTGGRIGWWLGQSGVIMAGLGTAVFLVPGLFFLVLVLPLLPVVIGLMMWVGGAVDDPWAYALGNALFFAWLQLALFPLAG